MNAASENRAHSQNACHRTLVTFVSDPSSVTFLGLLSFPGRRLETRRMGLVFNSVLAMLTACPLLCSFIQQSHFRLDSIVLDFDLLNVGTDSNGDRLAP